MSETDEIATKSAGVAAPLSREDLVRLAAEGLRLRRELEERMAPMKKITASDLQVRSR